MGVYEAAKDALKVAQKADNIELVQKLLDVQKMALDMQEKMQEQQNKIIELQKENEILSETKKYVLAPGKTCLIDPEHPERPLCPVCTMKLKTPAPLNAGVYCPQCKGYYE